MNKIIGEKQWHQGDLVLKRQIFMTKPFKWTTSLISSMHTFAFVGSLQPWWSVLTIWGKNTTKLQFSETVVQSAEFTYTHTKNLFPISYSIL